jgi:hypothetical protein
MPAGAAPAAVGAGRVSGDATGSLSVVTSITALPQVGQVVPAPTSTRPWQVVQ